MLDIRPRIIPVLLLREHGLYKTQKFNSPTYVGDPMNAIRIFNDKGADELIVVDIGEDVGRTGPDLDYIGSIASEAFIPLCYGGGVTSVGQFESLLKVGVEKVCINSAATGDMALVSEAARLFGSQSVVVGIDVRKPLLGASQRVINGGRTPVGDPVEQALRAEQAGAGEILLTSVDREGTQQGYDVPMVEKLAAAVRIPVIANGGAANLRNMLDIIEQHGASAAAAGALFVFQGRHRAVLITYPDDAELDCLRLRHV